MYKHALEKPVQENPDEILRRDQQEYLFQIFDEDFIREINKDDRKLFSALYNLFSRVDLHASA
jgi:hypothetical protein